MVAANRGREVIGVIPIVATDTAAFQRRRRGGNRATLVDQVRSDGEPGKERLGSVG